MARAHPHPDFDDIAPTFEDVPVPDWHLRLIEERLAEHEAHPEDTVSWDEVREELTQEIRSRRKD
jgi:hypothetical protein